MNTQFRIEISKPVRVYTFVSSLSGDRGVQVKSSNQQISKPRESRWGPRGRRAFFRQPGAGTPPPEHIVQGEPPPPPCPRRRRAPAVPTAPVSGRRPNQRLRGTSHQRDDDSLSQWPATSCRGRGGAWSVEKSTPRTVTMETDQLSMPVDDRAVVSSQWAERGGQVNLATDPSLPSSLDASGVNGAAKVAAAMPSSCDVGMTDDGATAEQSGSIITERPSSALHSQSHLQVDRMLSVASSSRMDWRWCR